MFASIFAYIAGYSYAVIFVEGKKEVFCNSLLTKALHYLIVGAIF